MSSAIPSRFSTFQSPSAAAHFTLPAPITSATRLRGRGAHAGKLATASVDVGVELEDGREAAHLEHLVHGGITAASRKSPPAERACFTVASSARSPALLV